MSILANKNGQSMIETIVAIAVISIGLIAAISLAMYSIRSGVRAEKRLVASFLAQEGIEIVRNWRGTNWLNGYAAWDDIYQDMEDTEDGIFVFDPYTEGELWQYDTNTNHILYYNSFRGIYSNVKSTWVWQPASGTYSDGSATDWVPTDFERHFEFETEPDPDGDLTIRLVTVTVSWEEPSGIIPKQEFKTRLYDWQQ